jgi:hypothetical protein
MTAAMKHGFRVKYSDGEMLPPGPKPVAAVPGTSIIVEVCGAHHSCAVVGCTAVLPVGREGITVFPPFVVLGMSICSKHLRVGRS